MLHVAFAAYAEDRKLLRVIGLRSVPVLKCLSDLCIACRHKDLSSSKNLLATVSLQKILDMSTLTCT